MRTYPTFARLHIGQTKSCRLDSSYLTDEEKPSFHVTSYQTDEVTPARFLVPAGRGRPLLLCDFVTDGRSPASLIPRTGQTSTSFSFAQLRTGRTMTSSPFARLCTGQMKSHLTDSLYRTTEGKLSSPCDLVTDGRSPAYLVPRT